MTFMEEPARIERNIKGEPAPPVEVRVIGRSNHPHDAITRIREVMRLVAEQRVLDAEAETEDSETWPSPAWWRQHLPSWFLDTFKGHTLEEILEDEDLWDYESWVDAIKAPGWEWWSSSVEPDRWTIKLWADSWPYAIEVFEYLARVAGTDDIQITEMDPE